MSASRIRMKTTEDWAHVPAGGRRAFVLRFGLGVVALFGITFTTLWVVAVDPLLFGAESPAAGELARHIAVTLVVWPIGGWLFARWMWRRNEKRFGRAGRDAGPSVARVSRICPVGRSHPGHEPDHGRRQ